MSSIPNRPISTTSSASNQNTKQPVKQNKPAATGGKAASEASSIVDTSETS